MIHFSHFAYDGKAWARSRAATLNDPFLRVSRTKSFPLVASARRRISLKPPNGPAETSAASAPRDFSIVFSPPHTVYGCARVLCITCRAYIYNLHIPSASCTYTGRNTGLCVSRLVRSHVCFPGFHVGSVTID